MGNMLLLLTGALVFLLDVIHTCGSLPYDICYHGAAAFSRAFGSTLAHQQTSWIHRNYIIWA
jgi:hypothetical protein